MSRYWDQADGDTAESDGLSIGEMARRTGLSVTGLRNWEIRYGVPVPHRTPAGQRRYRESDYELVAEVLRLRETGLSLAAAIERVRQGADVAKETSIFAGLRRRDPTLAVHKMDKRTLLALTYAIEDECCAAAQNPILLAAFQERRHYRPARQRWENMASTARQTVVFADFEESRMQPGPLAEIPIPADSPLRREWALICDASDQPACVLGWEPPGQDDCVDSERTFEAIWSVEPRVVRQAARIGISLAAQSMPSLGQVASEWLSGPARPASSDLVRASGLLERTLDYVSRM